jgi:hypothetical protein
LPLFNDETDEFDETDETVEISAKIVRPKLI